jgi:hypothetical protein
MRRVGDENLFACLRSEAGVRRGYDGIAYGNLDRALDLLDHARKVILLYVSRPLPPSEKSFLSIVAIVGEPEFRPDQEDFSVQHDDSAVVQYIPVQYRAADVEQTGRLV